ncbi:hypothetical protein D3C72_2540800 [compost metagenome]
MVALMTRHLTVQVVTLVAQQVVVIQAQAQQMPTAVGQPTDPMPVRAHRRHTLVEHVVLMLPHRNHRGL